LLQWPFVKAVFEKLPDVHKAIETSGYTTDEIFSDAMESCGLIMMDWKVSDAEVLKTYTGASIEPIRKHARMLAAGSTPFILRMPIIPGVNDNREHFETAAALVKNAKELVRVEILPYQRAAGAKYEMVGKSYSPLFDENKKPDFYPEVFEESGIPYRIFR
jgi:pyruvate formate lyase activating enzyme